MSASRPSAPLEMWAGVECTVNRVGDAFRDQIAMSGHAHRIDDLTRFASLGVRTLRYPVLWERVCPDGPKRFDWRWSDERLGRLRHLSIRPILGLLHHGSGPRWTSLVDPLFAEHFAAFAERVAERYPWVDAYTPINEPLTTARFSGLYGHWYPHARDASVFARCLLHQCTAIAAAMERIRRHAPDATLVATEDVGRIGGTPRLRYQVEFENERRWLSFDLLLGRVDRDHPLRGHLLSWGVREQELDALVDAPCPPGLVGVNHYVTSDRFLDEDLARYPAHCHGGNDRERYADVEAVRAQPDVTGELDTTLRDVWARFGLPMAVTETQLAGPREAQLRWLRSAWRAAEAARAEGIDVRAVTAWSLLGAFDWNSLLTRAAGYYESGAFDMRAPAPRPTALARLVRRLATGAPPDEPVADEPGWWARPERLFASVAMAPSDRGALPPTRTGGLAPRPVLICGARGTLGAAFARICAERGIAHRLATRDELDVSDLDAVERLVARTEPWAIVNAAGYVRVDDAERDHDRCFAINATGPANLARVCARDGIRLLSFSSDLVFDGARSDPYLETDVARPLSVYGRSKAAGERRARDACPDALVVRTAAFFGPWDNGNFLARGLSALRRGGAWHAASDLVVSPTFVVDLVHHALDLLIDRETGVVHLVNQGALTWAELARTAARLAGLDPARVVARPAAHLGVAAPRPAYSALASARVFVMPSLHDALRRFSARPSEPAQPCAGAIDARR